MELIQKLPEDIRRHIIPYTYRVQPQILLKDIVNYHQTFETLVHMYRKNFPYEEGWSENEDEFCFGWIINDIFGWLNHNLPTFRGYVPHFYCIWSRFTPFQPFQPSRAVMNFYLRLLEKKSNETQTRVFWALMTPYERKLFLIENDFGD